MQSDAKVELLSPKNKSILFHFKRSLQKNNMFLDTHICNIFDYRKQKLYRKQFCKLIRKFDENLILSQIDELFQELRKNDKNYILVQTLAQVLMEINSNDDPSQVLNRKSTLLIDSQQIIQLNALIQFKDRLIQNEEYLQTVQLFMTEKDGFLNRINISELLDNLGFKDQTKIQMIIQKIFNSKDRILLQQFLQILNLNNDGTRLRLQSYSIQESIILNQQKSSFIKELQNSRISREFNIQYSKILQNFAQMQNSTNSGYYAIQKIPKVLQQYFNYGSELQEPFAALASNYLSNKLIFLDIQSPTYEKAKSWIHISQFNPDYLLFQTAQSIIYRQDRKGLGMLLEPKDIAQGKFGNCYFLSALAAIVENYPELVYRLFVLEKNPSHIFGVCLFIDGIWKTIALDGCFPISEGKKFYGAQPHHSEIWVLLIEKAWAKIYKTYENIHSGYNEQGLVSLTGAPTIIILIKQQNFIQQIRKEFKKGSIITCTTAKHVSQIPKNMQQKLGVFAGHAYTILKIYDIKTSEEQILLFKMKNPWGSKAWKGDWSFQSSKWTKQLRARLNYNIDTLDGTFFICLNDFIKYFDHVNISKVNLGYRNSSVTNNASRQEFYYNIVKIKQDGDYHFTIYQDNGRKYKNSSGVYQKSPSWLYFAKPCIEQTGQFTTIQAMACNSSGYQHSSIQVNLQKGQYIIISKVKWNYWQKHPYVISSYGPAKVQFQHSEIAPVALINQFIGSWSIRTINLKKVQITAYNNTSIWKSYYFQHTQGVGFITIGNNQCQKEAQKQFKHLQTTLILNPCKGLQVLAPYTNPITIKVKPGQIVSACFVVNPQGYSYKLAQSYKLYILNAN